MANQKITSFTKLQVWQKAHLLVLGVYKNTKSFPKPEQFGLTNQICRAVVSITSNIAGGFSRQTKADKVHFYHIALGSCTEVQDQLIIAKDLHFISADNFKQLADLSIEVHKLLNASIKAIRAQV